MLIEESLIKKNKFTRSGQMLPIVNGVVIHWVDWPGAMAEQVVEYFNYLPENEPGRYASAHYVVGLEGEIIKMIPEDEIAWHAGPSGQTKEWIHAKLGGKPNWRTIGIELCHPDGSDAFLRSTWRSAVMLVADIMNRHNIIMPDRVFRHYDCVGKVCPRWFVDHPADWAEFMHDIRARL